MARQCQCGGLVSQVELTNGRERWSCSSCGRYEIKSAADLMMMRLAGARPQFTEEQRAECKKIEPDHVCQGPSKE